MGSTKAVLLEAQVEELREDVAERQVLSGMELEEEPKRGNTQQEKMKEKTQ